MIKVKWKDLPKTDTPFLSYCRKIKDSVDENEILEAYRGEVFALSGNIHQCAEMTVRNSRHGTPRFVKYRNRCYGSLEPKNVKSEGTAIQELKLTK